jgi:hypothetical protein
MYSADGIKTIASQACEVNQNQFWCKSKSVWIYLIVYVIPRRNKLNYPNFHVIYNWFNCYDADEGM